MPPRGDMEVLQAWKLKKSVKVNRPVLDSCGAAFTGSDADSFING